MFFMANLDYAAVAGASCGGKQLLCRALCVVGPLTDGDGVLHATLDRPVTVTVEGPGVLQALGSGNPSTPESFSTPTHRTFDGRALAIIRPTGPCAPRSATGASAP